MNPIALWTLVGWFALEAVGTVLSIGKPRKVITAEVAAATVLVNGILIIALLIWGR